MMASLQPACHTKKFSNDYYLTVTTEYDGCVCCVDLPDAKMGMSIMPLVNPETSGFVVPSDWTGSMLGEFHVDPSKETDSD